jgi:hypothetical protein
MPNRGRLLKLLVSLGVKGTICLICLTTVCFALVTYTCSLTISPIEQLSVGTASASWNIYVNEVNQLRYVPGGFSESVLNTGDINTYCFKIVTDANKVCAVKVELTSAMDGSKFSNFIITVRSSTGESWGTETLYTASTGGTTKASIDGLTQSDAAYIHQAVSTTKYYEIQVTYSYDKVNETSQIPVTFQFTPLPQNSFS